MLWTVNFFLVLNTSDKKDFEADVVVVLDSSTGVSQEHFRMQKQFAKSLATALNIGSGTRVSLMVYGDVTQLVARFDGYNSVADFERLVDRAPYLGGYRRLDKALEDTARIFSVSRQGTPRVLVLLTSGRQSQVPGAKTLDVASKYIKDLGVKRFVVATGHQIDQRELRLIVDRVEDIFFIQNVDSLVPRAISTARQIIARSGKHS